MRMVFDPSHPHLDLMLADAEILQTMAATGLLYIALMSVVVGEMLGRFILFRTALPL